MNTLQNARSLAFRTILVLLAILTGTATIPTVLGAASGSFTRADAKTARRKQRHYTVAPGKPFLGHRPSRDPEHRGGLWAENPVKSTSGLGARMVIATSILCATHPTSVAVAPGETLPWEGSVPTESGSVNTGNGDLLTCLHLVGWQSRGLPVDFSLYHNSESNYNGELGAGWTWTYDIYINTATGPPIVHWGDGLCVPFSGSGPSYSPPAGIYDQLVQHAGGTWTLTKKDGSTYQFNTSGFCTAISDTKGNTITLTLNSGNYCTKITDPTGKSLSISLNASDQFTGIVDPLGRAWNFTVSAGELTAVAWPSIGGTVYSDTYTYSSSSDILSHTDKRGETWTKTYTSFYGIASTTDPLNHTDNFAYTSSATTVTDPLSHVLTDNYSGGDLASRVDESGFSVSFTSRDVNLNPTSIVDKNSNTWTLTYDSKGNPTSVTDPLAHQWVWTYNTLAEVLSSTDPMSEQTQYTYSPNGNLLTQVDPLGHTVATNTYDTYGEILTSTDAISNTTSFVYDTNGNCTSVTNPLSNISTRTFDSINRLTSVTDFLGNSEQLNYDPWNRIATITHPDLTTITEDWDNQGNRTSVTDENGHTTSCVYDAAGRLTSIVNARSDVESYGYDAVDHLTSITDGNGHKRNYTITNRGETASVTLADGALEQWSYDGNGNTTVYTNPLNQSATHTYDSANRKTLISYPSGPNSSFAYDSTNRLTSFSDSTGTTSWNFDADSRVTSLDTPQGNMSYTYDNLGRRQTMVEAVGTTSYGYDACSRLTSLANPYSEVSSFTYDANGGLTKHAYSSGAYNSFGFDSRGRPISVVHYNSSGTVLSTETCTFDSADNLITKDLDSVTTNYAYDNANQLTGESSPTYSSTLDYDGNGNRVSQVLNGKTYLYSYDNGDKLDTVSSGGITVKAYTYDAAGRTQTVATATGTTTYSYDYEDRITGITYPGGGANSFNYNAIDARVGKSDSTGTYSFKRDGASPTDYVLSDGVIAYTPSISERKSGSSIFDHPNCLETFVRQTNAAQSTTASRVYDAFGNLESTTGSPQGAFGFVGGYGYQEDADSGLKLLGNRYYDPSTGRFLTRDRAKDGRNWYNYCDNAVTVLSDSSGYQAVGVWQALAQCPVFNSYPTVDAAAEAILNWIYPSTKKNDCEYGGWITGHPGGRGFRPDFPVRGTTSRVNPGNPPFDYAAGYHTHPRKGLPIDDRGPGYQGQKTGNPYMASERDKGKAGLWHVPEYIEGPGGVIIEYNPKTGGTTVVQLPWL